MRHPDPMSYDPNADGPPLAFGETREGGGVRTGDPPAPRPGLRARAVYVVATVALVPVVAVFLLWVQSEVSPQVYLWPFGTSWQLESADATLTISRQLPAP